jgi:hypothetical protein
MKVYILQYGFSGYVEAELEDPSTDLDSVASPQFHSIVFENELEQAIETLKQEIRKEAEEVGELWVEEGEEARWYDYPWQESFSGRRHFTSDFIKEEVFKRAEWTDQEVIARIVIVEIDK